ncbi:MAG: sulfurtransferase TusA family protein [Gammaproteobacteria bacterium]
MHIDAEIDLRGLRCPLPVLRVKKALGELSAGGVLRAFANDPGAAEDIPAFIAQTGHELREVSPRDGGHYFVVVKK